MVTLLVPSTFGNLNGKGLYITTTDGSWVACAEIKSLTSDDQKSDEEDKDSSNKVSTSVVVGAVIGAVAGVVLLVVCACYCYKRQAKTKALRVQRLKSQASVGDNKALGNKSVLTNPQIEMDSHAATAI